MIRRLSWWLAIGLFWVYVAVFPGSTLTVALGQVPAWGEWMGGALLFLQGAIVLGWLVARHGRRGALAAALVFALAWGVEWLGVTTGFPFGRYRYTAMLQPQLLGVPLAIPCAWLMVVLGAWQLAMIDDRRPEPALGASARGQEAGDRRRARGNVSCLLSPVSYLSSSRWSIIIAATLVLLLDLQIETVATSVNRYWVWLDGGAYYGVPTANFVAWWLVGLAMAAIVAGLLGDSRRTMDDGRWTMDDGRWTMDDTLSPSPALRLPSFVSRLTPFSIPAWLYLLNTLMFSAINLARGYTSAGLVGLAVALALGLLAMPLARWWPRGRGVSRARVEPNSATDASVWRRAARDAEINAALEHRPPPGD